MGGIYTLVSFTHWNLVCGSVRRNRMLLQNSVKSSSILMRKETHVCRIDVLSPQWHLTDWLSSHDLRPFYLIWMPFIFPDVCDGVCKDNAAPCFQSCPPESEGNMKFSCKAKKWHKVTETCHTLNAISIFEVMSILLHYGLSQGLCEWGKASDYHIAHLGEETGFHGDNRLFVYEYINTYLSPLSTPCASGS